MTMKAQPLIRQLLALLLFVISPLGWSWSDHASLAWPLVRSLPELNAVTIPAEPMLDFLEAEEEGVATALAEQEQWSATNLQHFSPTPNALVFQSSSETDLMSRFLAAIRVNPTLPYRLYRATTVDDVGPDLDLDLNVSAPLGWSDLSFLQPGVSHATMRYLPMEAGDPVSPAQVIASASDEPDFGMDIGLFEDNDTEFGSRYGFGNQPFGNPNLDYSSQAPFHMGFYQLDWLTKLAQPSLSETYPVWRIALYGRLANLAFRTGHPYWGWRFMGWSLHYIGDLTQPYHAVPLPGVGTIDALWLVAQGKTAEAIQLVSNRHGVIESYQYQRLSEALALGQWHAPLLSTIRGTGHDRLIDLSTSATDVTATLAGDSVAVAADLDAALTTWVPAQYVSDPSFEWTGSGVEATVIDVIRAEGGDRAIAMLDETLIDQMSRFSFYARAWINIGLQVID